MKLFGSYRGAYFSQPAAKAKKQKKPLRTLAVILAILLCLEGAYFFLCYTNIPFVAKWRTIYIETALSTMRHQWLATKLLPQDVVQEVRDQQHAAQEQMHGQNTTWDTPEPVSEPEEPVIGLSAEKRAFYALFWELDQTSMADYLEKHPEALENGWDGICLREAGPGSSGTGIHTMFGDDVLAIDVPNQLLLVRVRGVGYRGVLAVCKDPSRLSLQTSKGAGIYPEPNRYGQTAGQIAQAHGGLLAVTASGFVDEDYAGNVGYGNGGFLAGYAMADGEGAGEHYPAGSGWKRLELHEDDRLYITDVEQSVAADCTDAVEFAPALLVDGRILVDEYCGWTAINPRVCIGQTDKFEIQLLVIEGRLPLEGILGTDVIECAKIMQKYHCMQAMNMDGGTSAIMWYDGEYITRCSNTALPEGRPLPNAWVYAAAGSS